MMEKQFGVENARSAYFEDVRSVLETIVTEALLGIYHATHKNAQV